MYCKTAKDRARVCMTCAARGQCYKTFQSLLKVNTGTPEPLTVDLLIKIGCFGKEKNTLLVADPNQLAEGG